MRKWRAICSIMPASGPAARSMWALFFARRVSRRPIARSRLPSRMMVPGVLKRERRLRERDGLPVEVDVPFFDIDDEQVWGATAMVLAEFLAIVEGLER